MLLIALLGLIVLRKWRIALYSAGLMALLAIGLPLVSQGWQAWKLSAMQGREVFGTPPALANRRVLLLAPAMPCSEDACEAVIESLDPTGALVLTHAALAGLNSSAPLDLATLPLEIWTAPAERWEQVVKRRLTPDQARAAAADVDYLVITTRLFYLSQPGPVESALRQNPAYSRARPGELVRLVMAPLSTPGQLSFADLQFDILDLWLGGESLGVPLAPDNNWPAANTNPGAEAAAQAICPMGQYNTYFPCLEALE